MNYNTGKTHNGRGTFVVKIEHCDRQTWQGEVLWADERKSEKFRSALELLGLINEAVSFSAMEQIDKLRKQG